MAILRLKQADGTWAEVPALKGDPGQAGSDGKPGKDGADGYTPVRGTDYWTDADKAEIKGYVDEAVKDIDIPTADPYELPVASADTLGGVKVGNGLAVDEAGVLEVSPEAEYELIEQVTLTEDTSLLRRDEEPDGTKYKLAAALVLIETPEDASDFKTSAYTSYESLYVGRFALASGNGKRYAYFCSEQNRGIWTGRNTTYNSSTGATVTFHDPYDMASLSKHDAPYIDLVRIYTLPAGTKVTIKGVRA